MNGTYCFMFFLERRKLRSCRRARGYPSPGPDAKRHASGSYGIIGFWECSFAKGICPCFAGVKYHLSKLAARDCNQVSVLGELNCTGNLRGDVRCAKNPPAEGVCRFSFHKAPFHLNISIPIVGFTIIYPITENGSRG